MDYEVKLEIFEGPMDLLIHLIHKNEMDIFDIPISIITDQYLEYIDMMKALNINVAGDFLIMASTLIHVKSKMLLPGLNEDEEDPIIEITQPLLEYMQFKEIAENLLEREILDKDVFTRKPPSYIHDEANNEDSELDVNFFQLMDAFKRVMEKELPGIQLKLRLEEWSLKEKTELIVERLKKMGDISFQNLFDEDRTVSEFVITFLALLELVHMGLVKVFQPTPKSDIKLSSTFNEKSGNSND